MSNFDKGSLTAETVGSQFCSDRLKREITGLFNRIGTLEEVRKAAQMIWDAGMITVSDETDRGRCERLKDALEKAREK